MDYKQAFLSQLENSYLGVQIQDTKDLFSQDSLSGEALKKSGFINLLQMKSKYFGHIKNLLEKEKLNHSIYTKLYNVFSSYLTETGTPRMGVLKSAVGIGGLLAMGIGDTIRVSLSADPIEEVYAARDILKVSGVRKEGPELISCPTCGRTRIDLIGLAQQVEERLQTVTKPITVAVMGCVVNGPGEASAADVGIAGGDGVGLLFRRGEIVKKVPQEQLVDELFKMIDEL